MNEPEYGNPGVAFIQWKGTDVCMDIFCTCGSPGHFDGQFAYTVKCPECGRLWNMPSTVQATEVDTIDHEPVILS